ncbi:MAG TPA: response regulator transcription factor [Phenylobacterium sp.]|uniref:response regulator transcription factor n=1 Tax=Phenylobacterium sp. TaxID=1871053 RepID=UPI002B472D60|nr:response regulator transcription factor [Phenylobacterium sp.]HKR88862.1 response regulator transcription factor [Phenylobacterium sp.]
MRLLIAEDDPMLGAGLKRALERAGYAADWAKTGEEAVAAVAAESYALMLLDLGLPEMSGLQALRAIRGRRETLPIIIITAQDRAEQKVEGLDAGADDYVVKPFDLDELMARIRARIRSRDRRSSDQLEAHGVVLDLAARTVAKDGRAISLTAKEFRVLAVLMRRMGQFVSKAELEAAIYDGETGIESNTIETAVYALRRKLGAELILTARGLGYTVPRLR